MAHTPAVLRALPLAIFTLLVSAPTRAQTLSNPGFEDPYAPISTSAVSGAVAGGWSDNTWAPGVSILYSRETNNPHAGAACQRIEVLSGFAQFVQYLPLQTGRTTASIWMRASGPTWAALMIRGDLSTNYKVYGASSVRLSSAWQQVSFSAPTQTDPDAGLYILSAGTGTLWLDSASISFSPSPIAPAQTLSPPSSVIPRSYFGLHPQHQFEAPFLPWPSVDFGTARSHDSAPFWSQIEPNAPVGGVRSFDWTNLDAFVNAANARGIRVVYTIYQTPAWAATSTNLDPYGATGGNSPPSDIAHYSGFVSALATRYRGRIAAYEVWNEPDLPFWVGTPAQMAALASACAGAVRAADPGALVVAPPPSGGGAYLSPMGWYEQFLAAGGGQSADIMACHFYSAAPEEDIDKAATFRSLLSAYGLQNKPLWHDEAGIGYDGSGDEASTAAFVGRAYVLNWALNIPLFAWYAWSEDSLLGPRESSPGNWNLLTRPARAYQEVQGWLVGSVMISCASDAQGRWTATITRDGFTDIIAWSPTGPASLPLPLGAARVRTLDGGAALLNGQTSVNIGTEPILIEVGRVGACCSGAACSVVAPGQCTISSYRGDGTTCGTAGNPTSCCRANFNAVGGVTVQDIFDFLSAWFAGLPTADSNGANGVTVQDIFDFLSAWFAGCP